MATMPPRKRPIRVLAPTASTMMTVMLKKT